MDWSTTRLGEQATPESWEGRRSAPSPLVGEGRGERGLKRALRSGRYSPLLAAPPRCLTVLRVTPQIQKSERGETALELLDLDLVFEIHD